MAIRISGNTFSPFGTNFLTTGEEVFPRELATASGAPTASGQLRLTYFTCRKTESTSQLRMYSGSTPAAATPTLVRMGLYSIAANGDGALVASTTNDTTLFSVASTMYLKSWSAPYTKTAGQRYALALLIVTATTLPTLLGSFLGNAAMASSSAPVMSSVILSQTDLPASYTTASLVVSGHRYYTELLP
jgi:hypothetical protein